MGECNKFGHIYHGQERINKCGKGQPQSRQLKCLQNKTPTTLEGTPIAQYGESQPENQVRNLFPK